MPAFSARIITTRSNYAWMDPWYLDEEGGEEVERLWEQSSRFLTQHPYYAASATQGGHASVGVVDADNPVLAVSFSATTRRGLKRWLSPFFSSFSGPLISNEHQNLTGTKSEKFWRDALHALAEAIPTSVDVADIIFPPGMTDLRALAWKGWTIRAHYNYVTRWTEEGEWRAKMSSAARRQEKKARESLAIRVVTASQTKHLEQLWQHNAKRQKLDATLSERLDILGDWLGERGWGFIVEVVDAKENVHAAALVGHDQHRAYYLAGASSPEHLGSGAPTLLQASIHEEIEKRNLPRCYDWVGANTQSVVRFKQGFGPELEVLFAARRLSKKAKLMHAAGKLLRGQ